MGSPRAISALMRLSIVLVSGLFSIRATPDCFIPTRLAHLLSIPARKRIRPARGDTYPSVTAVAGRPPYQNDLPRHLTSTFGSNAKRGVLRLQSGDHVSTQFTHEFQKFRSFRFRSTFNVVILDMVAFHPTCVQVCGIRLPVSS